MVGEEVGRRCGAGVGRVGGLVESARDNSPPKQSKIGPFLGWTCTHVGQALASPAHI